jgi:hypothetical protein
LLVFQHVNVLEGYVAAGAVLTGRRCVGSEILSENKNRLHRHKSMRLATNNE